MAEEPTKPMPIYVVSDGTGETAEKVVRAALRQFRGHLVHVHTIGDIQDPDEMATLFATAEQQGGMIVTTLVTSEMRQTSKRLARRYRVRHLDLLGSLLSELEGFFEAQAVEVPGLLHEVDDNYFKRIEAVEFTVKADDGKEPRMLKRADIVLVGVSRTSKTPLSTFLAHKGFKVGNVPLVLDRPPPPQLFEVDQTRVFALEIDPDTLRGIRDERLRSMGLGSGKSNNYSDMDYILAELEYASDLFAGNPDWPVIDVTNRALEETASIILRYMNERGFAGPVGDVGQL